MLAYLNFPQWLKPEIIPGLPVRWYGLMYLVAFGIAYFLMMRQIKENNISFTEDETLNIFFWSIIGLLIGARVLATTVYDPSHYYLTRPWLIFWPFRNGQFTGLQGMSYHGGVIGAVLGSVIYCRVKKLQWFQFADVLSAGIPLGYTFGRLGNFINGELWGRVTAKPWGMIFPHAQKFPVSADWVQDIAAEIGMQLPQSGLVNLPRHPSQLYEALFEGIILWVFLWFVIRRRKKFHGSVFSFYLIGYGVVRFFIEYLREPDRDLGFVLQFGDAGPTPALFNSFLNFSTGQILCALMIIGGVILYTVRKKQTGNSFEPVEDNSKGDASAGSRSTKNAIRKKRKSIK
ncbi:MAG: prolipoprotein diacylglyceryl transferase [Spirochaetales bacterium]|uniref:Phosphatidylglycerol--prolipoprotein diacylglyceryl transferase n=1 Tax=Candidatus Thalassospirochaeta sargassi TaxID=3119039 RepID=A0AAJ1MN98_9SPIO|nr:prolipoprotein diacylglyceryl transferase [Spirochaetales bacterium]